MLEYPANVSGAELAGKVEAIRAYEAYDPVIGQFQFAADRQYVIQTVPEPAELPTSPSTGS